MCIGGGGSEGVREGEREGGRDAIKVRLIVSGTAFSTILYLQPSLC